tara:strand:- start:126 stop:1004 length:879 start_codon:yes stop_codon:yes gene_type:complete
MMLTKLEKGDEVNILAPASFIEDEAQFNVGLEILKTWGLKINKNNLINRKFGYFSANDKQRLIELEKGQSSKLIIFAKGGWGSARLLEEDPKWKPSWMLGFSDTSSLLISKYANGHLGSIHGPMIKTLAKEPSWSLRRLKNLLFDGFVDDIAGSPLIGGIAKGDIIVSNLTIFSYLIGTNHLPDLKGKIIVFEDINEDIYKLDRIFTYLRMSNKLNEIVGLGFGNFFSNTEGNHEENLLLKNLIYERFKKYNIPIVIDLPVGHLSGNACIPIGFKSTLNGDIGSLSVDLKIN